MIGHVISALVGLSMTGGAASFAIAFTRGGVWRWVDEDGVHAMAGTHPPDATRVVPNPLWYAACADVVSIGALLALHQIPLWARWTGRALDIDATGSVGLATGIAGVYMIARAVLAWRDTGSHREKPEEDPQLSSRREEEAGRDIEIDLDIAGRAKESTTHFLMGLLPAGLRATVVGAILLTTGTSALIALPAVIRGHADKSFLERLATAPALATLIILALIMAGAVVASIFGILSLTGLPAWACAGLTVALALGAVFAGLILGLYPSWDSVTHLARQLFDG